MKPKQRADVIFQHYTSALEELILDISYRPLLSASRTVCSALWIAAKHLNPDTRSFDALFGFRTSFREPAGLNSDVSTLDPV